MIAVTKQQYRRFAAGLAIGAMSISLVMAFIAFLHVLSALPYGGGQQVFNFNWFQFGTEWVRIGWIFDPLTAVMLVMVTFVGLLIFIYSIGYMAEDPNFTRFFGFLSLFAGAMLGVALSNSLLTLFMCWEIVGLTSYLLIGFWFANPKAAAAAKKAFIVTRIGDLGFFLGMMWLYGKTGTLLFYDGGAGCLEHSALSALTAHLTLLGTSVSSAIGILIFCGAAGKSGQVPLHVWLPDAMEGPTPVSALIHAATMVAAGVFLIARIYPLMSAPSATMTPLSSTAALQLVTWVGAVTALFGAIVAVAQWDIKRILAYSTMSQLGYMMMGLGVGGVAVGMFHLITHAFFKALLFLGAGSVIHGYGGEQDIRRMGGLRGAMPVTFVTYSCGMLALCGFPLFAGFWSKDEILHAASIWSVTRIPFYMGVAAALLTAFYMIRQMYYVYAGASRQTAIADSSHAIHGSHHVNTPHESPAVMTGPLVVLACFATFLGFAGTPLWPWFQAFLDGKPVHVHYGALTDTLPLMVVSSLVVISGLALGWFVYGKYPIVDPAALDPLEKAAPRVFSFLTEALFVNEFYQATVVRPTYALTRASLWLDQWVWGGVVRSISSATVTLGRIDSYVETHIINGGFNAGCKGVSLGARTLSHLQSGRAQTYLRFLAVVLAVGAILLMGSPRL
ncbi:NADH-quinone oxidoreductase subunit L [Granulicella sp. 5B5]|uniref:NADH-quinone oxidoreductase subunit L n=1 Tax=Granulicella sp. 5B5 TaxID=1617967 RepID=UPI0021029B98|nr:NADH-quinone oxidoreductase subunit L [Granulicella sp. 5B5]